MKLNATLFLQMFNFFLLYWLLRLVAFKEISLFIFKSRRALQDLKNKTTALQKKEQKLVTQEEEILSDFKRKILLYEQRKQAMLPLAKEKLPIPETKLDTSVEEAIAHVTSLIQKECDAK